MLLIYFCSCRKFLFLCTVIEAAFPGATGLFFSEGQIKTLLLVRNGRVMAPPDGWKLQTRHYEIQVQKDSNLTPERRKLCFNCSLCAKYDIL